MPAFHRGRRSGFPGQVPHGFFPMPPARGGFFGSDIGSTGPDVPTDGPSSAIYVPQNSQDFTDLGLPVPDFLWLCQEASGNLDPAIGNATVTMNANATPLYQQSVTGWTRKFVGTADGTAGQRFGSTSALLNVSAGQSVAFLAYASVASAGTRRFLARPAANGVRVTSAGLINSMHNSVSAAGAVDHNSLTTVHPWLWYRNATTNASGTMTDLEHVVGTHDESAISAVLLCLGADSTNLPPDGRYGWAAYWIGANAETIAAKATLQTLGWAVAW